MTPELFVAMLLAACAAILGWGFRVLPGERWQMMAAVPLRKNADGSWAGWNLTWYGFLIATGNAAAVMVFLALAGSVGASLLAALGFVAAMLSIGLPASRLAARIIERKRNNSSSAGALFICVILSPAVMAGYNLILEALGEAPLPMAPIFAAQYIAFVLGEALGRLGCISFGCCCGVPLDRLSPVLRRAIDRFCFVFSGSTKKISYESGLEGVKVVPIQGLTSIVCSLAGAAGALLFLKGHFIASLLIPLAIAQAWRVLSEVFRTDFRGRGKISKYQKLSPISALYAVGVLALLPAPPAGLVPDIAAGLGRIWDPGVLVILEVIWGLMFIYLGKSKVTGSTLSFFVHRDRI